MCVRFAEYRPAVFRNAHHPWKQAHGAAQGSGTTGTFLISGSAGHVFGLVIVVYLLSLEGITPTIVEEMEGRHRITTCSRCPSAAAQWKRWKEDIESQLIFAAAASLTEWKRWKEDIESQPHRTTPSSSGKWKRWKEDIESQPFMHRICSACSGKDGRKTSNHN